MRWASERRHAPHTGSAVAMEPKLASAQLGLGRTLVQTDPAAAETAFLAALAAVPDDSAALNDLGIARDLLGHHAEAQDAYRQALAITPEATDVKMNLGLSLALTGDKDAAVGVLREAAAVPATVQDRSKELAAALSLAGDQTDADQILSTGSARPVAGNVASAEIALSPHFGEPRGAGAGHAKTGKACRHSVCRSPSTCTAAAGCAVVGSFLCRPGAGRRCPHEPDSKI